MRVAHKGDQKGDLIDRVPPDLRSELDVLRKQEARILDALRDEGVARRFLEDPARALSEMEIPVPAALKKALKHLDFGPKFLDPRKFQLPNGQVITAKVRVRFVAEEEGAHAGH